jgi:hypothetical protein
VGISNPEKTARGTPRKTPYADAHRLVADLPVDELRDSPNDTVAIRVAKSVARQSIDGKVAFAVEAANRTEGKPREMDNTEQPVDQKKDLAATLKFIRQVYGLEDPPDPPEDGQK